MLCFYWVWVSSCLLPFSFLVWRLTHVLVIACSLCTGESFSCWFVTAVFSLRHKCFLLLLRGLGSRGLGHILLFSFSSKLLCVVFWGWLPLGKSFYIYIILFMFICSFGSAGSLLLPSGFLYLQWVAAALHCNVWAPYGRSSSCCGAQVLGARASVVAAGGI